MKTMNFFIALLLVCIAATTFAKERPQMTIHANDEKLASIQFQSPEPTLFNITICKYDGEVVFHKKYEKRTDSYSCDFDFSELENGKYHVCINYGNKSINRDLAVSDSDIRVAPSEFYYEPYFKKDGEKLNVSHFNVAQKEVYVNVYRNNRWVYGYSLGKKLSIQKQLDLSPLEKGEYRIELKDGLKEHLFYVQL